MAGTLGKKVGEKGLGLLKDFLDDEASGLAATLGYVSNKIKPLTDLIPTSPRDAKAYNPELNISKWSGKPYTAADTMQGVESREKYTYDAADDATLPGGFGGGKPSTDPVVNALEEENTRRKRGPSWMSSFNPDTVPMFPDYVKAYRADPTGHFGGKDGLETRPKDLDAGSLYAQARNMAATKEFGTPQLTPEEFAAFALKEGRGDMGVNAQYIRGKSGKWEKEYSMFPDMEGVLEQARGYDPTMKGDKEFYDELRSHGVDHDSIAFATTLRNKKRQADRLGIPLPVMWNGTGKNTLGQSGDEYGDDYKHYLSAVSHPKNQDFMKLIKQAIEHGHKHPIKKSVKVASKASGGAITIDDGNPAKRRKLI